MFSHEVVPDHLRTKPDPEVEEQEKQLSTDAARIGTDVAQVIICAWRNSELPPSLWGHTSFHVPAVVFNPLHQR